MVPVIARAVGWWVPLVPLAILNAGLREVWLAPALGRPLALPLSGVSLSVLIFLFTLAVAPRLRASARVQYAAVGATWLLLTVLFEFVFGRYVVGHPWARLLDAYDVASGNLWVVVLLSTAASPYCAAKVRRLV